MSDVPYLKDVDKIYTTLSDKKYTENNNRKWFEKNYTKEVRAANKKISNMLLIIKDMRKTI